MDIVVKSEEQLDRVDRILREVRQLQGAHKWSNGEVARRADIPGSTFSEVMRGVYRGNPAPYIDKLERWIALEAQELEVKSAGLADIGFVETSVAKQMITALRFAQSRPALVMLTLGSGLGKTMTLSWYAANHNNAWRVVIEPIEGKPRPAMRRIATAVGAESFHINSLMGELKQRLSRAEGRQCLLMIDEAQNLTDAAVNQLRFLLDEARCGIALAGNEDLMTRYALAASREGYGQIHRRVFMRVHEKTAPSADIDLLLDKVDIHDPAIRKLAHQIGSRAGGFGQVMDTLHLASLLAYGKGRMLSADDVRDAWSNRAREVIR